MHNHDDFIYNYLFNIGLWKVYVDQECKMLEVILVHHRLHVSRDKMRLAYPQTDAFFSLKKKYDPEEIFSNQFYLHYRES